MEKINKEKLLTKPNEIQIEKQEKILEIILKWCNNLTIHAIPNIFRTEYLVIRIIWILALLTSSGFCAYMVYGSINNYLQFGVITTIRVTSENPMIFPSITLCNANAFVTEESYSYTDEFITNIFGLNSSDILKNEPKLSILYSKYPLFMRYFASKFFIQNAAFILNETQKKSFGFPINKTLISCFFGLNDCDESDFTYYYDFLYGNCYKFNTGKYLNGSDQELKTISKIGKQNGLMLELFVGNANNPKSLSIYSGAHLFIHNDSLTPSTNEGIDLNVGTSTNIAVHKSFISKLPKPYSDCTDNLDKINSFNSELFRTIIKSNNIYRRSDCFNLCYQKKLLDQCGCYDASVQPLNANDDRICANEKQTLCLYSVFDYFTKKGFNELCSNDCPVECHSTQYSLSTSSLLYPSRAYAHNMLKDSNIISRFDDNIKLDYELLKESILSVNIYFDALESTNIEENVQTEFVDLIAGIGGTLGLFLGVSALSLFEFVEIFLEIFIFKWKRLNKISFQKKF